MTIVQIQSDRCYACGKRFRDPNRRQDVFLSDDGHRSVLVGPECFRKIVEAAAAGHQPARGGSRLFLQRKDARVYAARLP